MGMANEKRYWIYSHDADGLLVDDIGEEDELSAALDDAGDYIMMQDSYKIASVTVHIVENGTTIWIAGAGQRIDGTD